MEHFGHLSIVFVILISTLLFYFRTKLTLSLFIASLLFIVLFNNLFLHIDHNAYQNLSIHIHECCILPIAVSVAIFSVFIIFVKYFEQYFSPFIALFFAPRFLYYSRPPPYIS